MSKSFSDLKGNSILLVETPWDSRVLNLKTCELKLIFNDEIHSFLLLFDEVNEYLKNTGYQYMQIRCDSNNRDLKHILNSRGYYIAEMSLSLSYANPSKLDLSKINRINVDLDLVTVEETDALDFFKEIAHQNFHHGRLIEDVNIDEKFGRQRSANWIDDLVATPFSLYKASFRGNLIGFHAERVSEKNNTVNWILTGVSEKYSVYALPLWSAAFKLAQDNNVANISTMISASNTKVLNLYNRFPFRVDGSWYGFHKIER